MPARLRPAASWRGVTSLAVLIALLVSGLEATPASAEIDAAAETALLGLVHASREANGVGALRMCADLRDQARTWSRAMAGDGRLSHNPDLTDASGWQSLGENVGVEASVHGVHARFMDSAGHRAHILSTRFTEVGVGVEQRDGRMWVTEVFREPDGSAPCDAVHLDEAIATACPPARVPAAGFDDLGDNPHEAAVNCAVWYGLANGTGDGAFSPSDRLTRAQMAALLTRLAERSGLRLPAPRDQGFADIAGNPHADAINQLAELSIVHGVSSTTYGPSALVTRAQTATFLVRAYERITGERLVAARDWFTDDNGLVHEGAINQAGAAAFVAGLSPTAYGPHRDVRRDQIASALARLLSRLVQQGHLAVPS